MPAILSALQYGFAGLSAIMLILAFRIIQTEQGKKIPRPEILRQSVAYMGLTLGLSIANIVVQILDERAAAARSTTACAQALTDLQGAIRSKRLYEAAISSDPDLLEATIARLQDDSDKSFKACGVTNTNEPARPLGQQIGSAAQH
jgi:hypothetical protein